MANHSVSIDFYNQPKSYINPEAQRHHRPQYPVLPLLPHPMPQTIPRFPPSQTKRHTFFHKGLAAASLLLGELSGFASHSKRKLRWWASCYGSKDHEPVIHLQNDMTIVMMNNDGVYEPFNGEHNSMMLSGDQRRGPLWQKNILMGGKCQLPDFSGVILYDSDGHVVPPAKNSLPLLTWK